MALRGRIRSGGRISKVAGRRLLAHAWPKTPRRGQGQVPGSRPPAPSFVRTKPAPRGPLVATRSRSQPLGAVWSRTRSPLRVREGSPTFAESHRLLPRFTEFRGGLSLKVLKIGAWALCRCRGDAFRATRAEYLRGADFAYSPEHTARCGLDSPENTGNPVSTQSLFPGYHVRPGRTFRRRRRVFENVSAHGW